MPSPVLESVSASLNYADLPETWRLYEPEQFSAKKSLYDYQTDALKNATRALFLYYGKDHKWNSNEPQEVNITRKQNFANSFYQDTVLPDVKKYEKPVDEVNGRANPVFEILSDYIDSPDGCVEYHNLINRMCFWMATGSGKTLVMVKLIEYLHSLINLGEIPAHNILILAPSDHLINQIKRVVDEFNATGLYINLVPLSDGNRKIHSTLSNSITVYYYRSDNISDMQSDARVDYRTYENDGKWYVLLDEAHKGGKENSKRQAYYALMAREGFLFNFSATFTDTEDILTTVKKYNLEEFIKNGHGKNIYLNEEEYNSFRQRDEINDNDRQKIVLKSLITLAHVSIRVADLRNKTGVENLYHKPLMLTLVNSVNADIKNDLWAFFQTLQKIATNQIDQSLFKESCRELAEDWGKGHFLFGEKDKGISEKDIAIVKKITIADLREAVFLSRRKSAIQLIRSSDNKELAFQMRNADAPFALIRIGNTAKWRNELLVGYEDTTALQKTSFFDQLENSQITILMGSRSFFESWDSNRPNVINFINIGGREAQKFVVQSVGRGVRIETLPNQRKRMHQLLPALESESVDSLRQIQTNIQPPETLFLFATNRTAVQYVLEGLRSVTADSFENLAGIDRAPIPKIDNVEMPILVPKYKKIKDEANPVQFVMSDGTLSRMNGWLENTSDSVLAVRDGLTADEISALRDMVKHPDRIKINRKKEYAKIPFLQNRLVSHFSCTREIADGIREVNDEDIVHFRRIRVHSKHIEQLQAKIKQVAIGYMPDDQVVELSKKLNDKEITRQEYDERTTGKDYDTFNGITITKLLGNYYLPMLWGSEKAKYIRHIIKNESEVNFLKELEKWVRGKTIPWDAWMFSKLDEWLDEIHIPYYDGDNNQYREFFPDFVFWMCKGSDYRIVFVDPKGMAHTNAYHKIDGYKELFETELGEHSIKQFHHDYKKWNVSVHLLMLNQESEPLKKYQQYWIKEPGHIFSS